MGGRVIGLLGENDSNWGCLPGENYTRLPCAVPAGIVRPDVSMDGWFNDDEKLLGLGGKGAMLKEPNGWLDNPGWFDNPDWMGPPIGIVAPP